ncbi:MULTISPECIES: serine protease [unclassified Aeromonas]|uniref:S1 family peptidase n=1 Tax=unclassified Aeromonas TaxID=257493 RepID=UPI003526C82D
MDVFTQFVAIVGRMTPSHVEMLGTAFMISSNGSYATSRHVIGNDPNGLVILAPNIKRIDEYQDVSDTSCQPLSVTVLEIDPIKDLAIIKADISYNGFFPALASLDEVAVGENVGIFGYPHCTEGRRVLTFQSTAIGAKILLESSSIKSKHAVLNIQSRPGQSGSMVFSPRLQKVVGLLVGTYAPQFGISLGGINPAELNQTTHIISAEYIQEMM